jgi:hypothetical protein
VAPFDRYIAVDWSASNQPKLGNDSIWSCDAPRADPDMKTANHKTRHAAEGWLCEQLTEALAAGQRVLVALDFPYGYPAGFARALGVDGWKGIWEYLERHIRDDEENVSNRFEVAAEINRGLGRGAPFWGRPGHLDLPALPVHKLVTYRGAGEGGLAEWRQVEEQLRRRRPGPQVVWKLAYTGAVGSQSLVGIPVLRRVLFHEGLREVSRVGSGRSTSRFRSSRLDLRRSFTPRSGPRSSRSATSMAAARTSSRCGPSYSTGEDWIAAAS